MNVANIETISTNTYPNSRLMGITAIAAPTTHMIWKRVSKRANDRPLLASGASRCTIESKASLPVDPAQPTVKREHERRRDAREHERRQCRGDHR